MLFGTSLETITKGIGPSRLPWSPPAVAVRTLHTTTAAAVSSRSRSRQGVGAADRGTLNPSSKAFLTSRGQSRTVLLAHENAHRNHPQFCHTRGIKIQPRSFGPPSEKPKPESEPTSTSTPTPKLKLRGRIRPRAMKPKPKDEQQKTVIAGWKTAEPPPGAGPLSSSQAQIAAAFGLARQRVHRGGDRRRTRAKIDAEAAVAAEEKRRAKKAAAAALARRSHPPRELSASVHATIARIRKEEEEAEAAAKEASSRPSFVPREGTAARQQGKASHGAVTFDSSSSLYDSDTALDSTTDLDRPTNIDSVIRDDIFIKPRRYVACLLDADSLYFNLDLVKRGVDGGAIFYKMLTEQIKSHLQLQQSHQELTATLSTQILSSSSAATASSNAPRNFNISLRLVAFANLGGLSNFFRNRHGISQETFRAFQTGLLQASPWSVVAHAGSMPQAADIKVKAHLLDMLHDSDCLHVYLGGLNDVGYARELEVLRTTGKLKRLSLLFLPGAVYNSRHYEQYMARVVLWPHLFSDDYSHGHKHHKHQDDSKSKRRRPSTRMAGRRSAPRWTR